MRQMDRVASEALPSVRSLVVDGTYSLSFESKTLRI